MIFVGYITINRWTPLIPSAANQHRNLLTEQASLRCFAATLVGRTSHANFLVLARFKKEWVLI